MSDVGHSDYCIVDSGLPDIEDCLPCLAWMAKEQEYYRKEYEAVGRREMENARTYVQDMRDAGREHLLTEADLDRADWMART